jgi:hypothetical protein
MGILGRVALVVLVCAAAGCSRSERGVQGRRLPNSVLAAKPKPAALTRESIYDAQGNLKPSSVSVGWLAIPQGLSERPGRDGEHLFRGSVPLKAIARFMDARIFTSDIRVETTSVRYGMSRPKNQDKRAMPLDVAAYANPAGTHVELIIKERPPTVVAPMTTAELKNLLKQKQARAE